MPIQLSPYKLSMYKKCPKQYAFYCDAEIRNKYKTDKPYFTMGQHIHQALHDIYANVDIADRNIDKLTHLLRLTWTKNRRGFKDQEQEAEYGNRAIRQLQQYVIKDDLKKQPLLLEEMHQIDLDDGNLKFLGKIDRVDETEDGMLHIIDYKTGKTTDEEPDFDQLYFYALILDRKLARPILKASYLYLEGYQWVDAIIDRAKLKEIEEKLVQQAHKIINDKEFSPTPNAFCRSCDYLEICPKKIEALSFSNSENSSPLPF